MAVKYTIHLKCDADNGACQYAEWVDVNDVQPASAVDVADHVPEGWAVDPDGVVSCPIHGGG